MIGAKRKDGIMHLGFQKAPALNYNFKARIMSVSLAVCLKLAVHSDLLLPFFRAMLSSLGLRFQSCSMKHNPGAMLRHGMAGRLHLGRMGSETFLSFAQESQ